MESISLWGTIVNVLAVIAGSGIGLFVKYVTGLDVFKSKRRSDTQSDGVMIGKRDFSDTIMKGLGLCVLLIGVSGAIKTDNTLLVIVSMALGGLVGEALNLDRWVSSLGDKVEGLTKGRFGKVSEGFVTASLLFCVGAMTIVGSLNSGLNGDHGMLYAKSVLDFVASIVFATSLGVGVAFSSAFVLVFQGSITLLAQWISPWLTEAVVTEMTAVGSLLIIGVAFNVMNVTKIKVMNLLPAMFFPILLCRFM